MTKSYQLAVGLANLLVLSVAAWMAYLQFSNPQAYYLSVQEDEFIEWTCYAAFLGAAIFHWVESRRRNDNPFAFWFLAGIGLFCFFVAGEELSWGQRLLGWRAPEYFLIHNFEQEVNLHNVVGKQSQNYLLVFLIMGYGMVAPLLATTETGGRFARQYGIVTPPVELSPAFFAGVVLFAADPWDRIDEVAELMWGICFLLAPVLRMLESRDLPKFLRGTWQQPLLIANVFALLIASGLTMAKNSSAMEVTQQQLESIETRRTLWELDLLTKDFHLVTRRMNRRLDDNLSLHTRVSSFARNHEADRLHFGKFSVAADSEGAKNRASFFLDPWNTPYWVVMTGNDERITTTVYSLGPNRRRDSSSHSMKGDDVGITIHTQR